MPEPVEILLAEDNPADAYIIRRALSGQGFAFHLQVCDDGEDALCYLRREGRHADARRPDLIVLDLNLPRYDGREILLRLRGRSELRRVPVAILSSSESPRDREATAQLGASCYLTKPSDLDEFMQVGKVLKDLIEKGVLGSAGLE